MRLRSFFLCILYAADSEGCYFSFSFLLMPAFVRSFLNAADFFLFFFKSFGILTVILEDVFANAFLAIFTLPFANVTLFSFLQFPKAFLPISVTFLPIVTDFSFFAPLNAFAEIETMVQLVSPKLTLSGIVILDAFALVSATAAAVFFSASKTAYSTFPLVVLSPVFRAGTVASFLQ